MQSLANFNQRDYVRMESEALSERKLRHYWDPTMEILRWVYNHHRKKVQFLSQKVQSRPFTLEFSGIMIQGRRLGFIVFVCR